MARKQRVRITLDGQQVDLSVTMGTLFRFEEATGRSAMQPDTWNDLWARDLLAFVWAALPADVRAEYPKPEDLADHVPIDQAVQAVSLIAEVIGGNPPSQPPASST